MVFTWGDRSTDGPAGGPRNCLDGRTCPACPTVYALLSGFMSGVVYGKSNMLDFVLRNFGPNPGYNSGNACVNRTPDMSGRRPDM